MKKLIVIALVLFLLLIVFHTAASAQTPAPHEPTTIDIASLFTWATTNPPNWIQAVLYAILGLVGALITIYYVMGGTIPTSAGVKLEAEFRALETKENELAALRKKVLEDPNSVSADLIREFSLDSDRQRDDLERKSQNMFVSWAVMYILLGMFFAVMLAQDLLQALTIGAGWTSVMAAFGLHRENKETKSEAARQADVVEKSVSDLEKKLILLKEKIDQSDLKWDANMDFEQTVNNAEEAVRSARLRAKTF